MSVTLVLTSSFLLFLVTGAPGVSANGLDCVSGSHGCLPEGKLGAHVQDAMGQRFMLGLNLK